MSGTTREPRRLGWRDQNFQSLGLRYQTRHCYEWHQIEDHAVHSTTNMWSLGWAHRLGRFAGFVADVRRLGFFDDSLRPGARRVGRCGRPRRASGPWPATS